MQTRKFPGCYESLANIREFICLAATEAGLSKEDVYAVELAVDEACCNIIDHAYGGEDIGDIECSVVGEKNCLKVILKDNGQPFDPSKIPAPQFGIPLEKLKPRGVGFYLMNKMMDEVHYKTSSKTGNIMTLVKNK